MFIAVAGCLFGAVGVGALLMADRRLGEESSMSASEALQCVMFRRRWDAAGPNREVYSAHCSAVGEPRPMRKVQDERVREISGDSGGRDARLPEAA